jgi:hypothetical protein
MFDAYGGARDCHHVVSESIGAEVGRLTDAIRVMPGLVPGIHAVRLRVDFRTPTFV